MVPCQRGFKGPDKEGDLPRVPRPLGGQAGRRRRIPRLQVVGPSSLRIRKNCVPVPSACPGETGFASPCSSLQCQKEDHGNSACRTGPLWAWHETCRDLLNKQRLLLHHCPQGAPRRHGAGAQSDRTGGEAAGPVPAVTTPCVLLPKPTRALLGGEELTGTPTMGCAREKDGGFQL